MIQDIKYKEHKIFAELSTYKDFYKELSSSILHFLTPGASSGIINFDTYLISSIQGTIESIRLILQEGKVNDAYSLTRKYHDSVVINIYEIQYLKDNFSVDNFVVQKINEWVKGKEKLPRFETMIKYIEKSKELARVNAVLNSDKRYEQIRNRCNDHTHYNFFYYMMLNDSRVYLKGRLKVLDQLSNDLRDIFIEHFIWLFTLNEHYMSSSDYIDSLDIGITPEEGSQYFVAPLVLEVFNDIVKKYRPDLAKELENSTCMRLKNQK